MPTILFPFEENRQKSMLLGIQTIKDFGQTMTFEELTSLIRLFLSGEDIKCEIPINKMEIILRRLTDQGFVFTIIN